MKKIAVILTFASIFLVSLVAQPQVPTRKDPDWAFPVINGALPAEPGRTTDPSRKHPDLSKYADR